MRFALNPQHTLCRRVHAPAASATALMPWTFIVAAPLELLCVFAMVASELDVLSALAGISITLCVIPLQVRRPA